MTSAMQQFDESCQMLIREALQEAQARGHRYVEVRHLLQCLLGQPPLSLVQACEEQQVSLLDLRVLINTELDQLDPQQLDYAENSASRSMQGLLKKIVDTQVPEKQSKLTLISIWQGIFRFQMTWLQGVFKNLKVAEANLVALSEKVQQMNPLLAAHVGTMIQAYCVDMLALAQKNRLDPVIGRDDEVRKVIQILSRRLKNNPILLGEPGVGKTAIVEGLAQRIVVGDIPDAMRGKKLLSLDVGSLVAGASFRGEFEERMRSLMREIQEAAGEVILFVDEIHLLMGAGKSEGSLDAANLLKPALARGELRCIGATTHSEYRKTLEKDPALVRRFQEVIVNEPDIPSTLAILRGLKDRYELYHGVRIKDAALVVAAQYSARYIFNRYLPDKAIDLIDEAAATLRMQMDSLPIEVDQIERKTMQMAMEQAALRKENEANSQFRLGQLQKEMASNQSHAQQYKERWQKERRQLNLIHSLKAQIETAKVQEKEAQRSGDLERAASIHYDTLDHLQDQLRLATLELESLGQRLLKEEVDQEDIARIVSQNTGIPLNRMLQEEKSKILQLEQHLVKRIVGQSEALTTVSNLIRRSRAGIQEGQRPIGSVMLIGAPGVGKTELAYSLAELLYNDPQALVRFDMSEYMEKNSASRLIGAPPGYVGFDEGGMLTEAVRKRPYTLLLFDEMEKAHPEVGNLFLQILDKGRLTDMQGRQVNFTNALILFTSNIGFEAIRKVEKNMVYADMVKLAKDELLRHFRPEFINRLDEVVVFHSLSFAHLRQIAQIQCQNLQKRLQTKSILLHISDEVVHWIAKKAFAIGQGARPLKRSIQRELEDPLAMLMLQEKVAAQDACWIDLENDQIHFRHHP